MADNTAPAMVEQMYDCFNRGDMDTIRNSVFAPDIVWRLPGRHPLGGVKQGADEVIAFFEQLNKAGIQVELRGIDTFGDDAAIEVHRGYGETAGVRLDAINCTMYTLRDGKIAEVQVFMSDQYGADNFFWAAYGLAPIPARLGG
ncbi:MAG: nuclear transport factor 2 family protein [Egibacteraceae bacterium]